MPISLAHSSTSLRPERIQVKEGVLASSPRQEEHSMARPDCPGITLPDTNGDGAWHFGSETHVYVAGPAAIPGPR